MKNYLFPSSNFLTSHILAKTILTDDEVYRRSFAEVKTRPEDAFTVLPSKKTFRTFASLLEISSNSHEQDLTMKDPLFKLMIVGV